MVQVNIATYLLIGKLNYWIDYNLKLIFHILIECEDLTISMRRDAFFFIIHKNRSKRKKNCASIRREDLELTHLALDIMVAISQTKFKCILWMKSVVFWLKFHWSLSLGVQMTISRHWFRQWIDAEQATSHCLNQNWPSLVTDVQAALGGRWVELTRSISYKDYYMISNTANVWNNISLRT